jgi:hypothetical protein
MAAALISGNLSAQETPTAPEVHEYVEVMVGGMPNPETAELVDNDAPELEFVAAPK